jgi:transcriptional regulator with XRE-family HTH domain
MGRREQTANYFGKRVKDERGRLDWSQSELAKRLQGNGFDHIYASTIAKIELGSRPTRIDEAIGIADLFDVSLDKMLGRHLAAGQDLVHALEAIGQIAQQATPVVSSTESALRDRAAELADFDFDERDAITAACERVSTALAQASDELATLWPPLREGLLAASTTKFIKGLAAEMGSDDTTEA